MEKSKLEFKLKKGKINHRDGGGKKNKCIRTPLACKS